MKFKEYIKNITSWDDYGPNSNNINLITEAGFSRVLGKIKKSESFVIITAYRNEYDKKENIKRNRDLRNDFNKKKMGVYQLVGHWKECQDSEVEYEDCPKNKIVDVIERSYLAVKPEDVKDNEFKNFVVSLVRKFNQDGALLKINNYYNVIDRNGKTFKVGENLSLNKLSQAYSQFVKKMNVPFVFEGMEIPTTNIGKFMATGVGIKYPVGSFDDLKNWDDI